MVALMWFSCAMTLAEWSLWSTAGPCGTSRSGDSAPTLRSSWWDAKTTPGSSTRMSSISATARRGVLLSGEGIKTFIVYKYYVATTFMFQTSSGERYRDARPR